MTGNILCIESSSEVCSVALFSDGIMVSSRQSHRKNMHAEVLAILIKEVIETAGKQFSSIDAVAVSNGPGSYTSLRVSLSTAKGICYALNKPLIALSSDHVLVEGNIAEAKARGCSHVIAMIDARRMEAYCTIYDVVNKTYSQPLSVIFETDSFAELEKKATRIGVCGNGAQKWMTVCKQELYTLLATETTADNMGNLAMKRFLQGENDDLAYTIPLYLKPPNITESKKNKWLP